MRMRTRWRGRRRVASIPSMPGIRMSMRTTSGACASAARDRLLAVARLGDDLDASRSPRARPEAGAHERLVVGDDDAQRGVTARFAAGAAPRGPRSRGRRAGPAPSVPPNSGGALAHPDEAVAAAAAVGGSPLALVGDRAARARRAGSARVTVAGAPPAWRTTFVTASWTIRYADGVERRGERARRRPRPRASIGTPGGARAVEHLVERRRDRAAGAQLRAVVVAAQELQRPVHLGHRPPAERRRSRRSPRGRPRRRVAPSACAWTTISETSWPTASWSSRAIRSRSSAAARSASSARSRAAAAGGAPRTRRADRRDRDGERPRSPRPRPAATTSPTTQRRWTSSSATRDRGGAHRRCAPRPVDRDAVERRRARAARTESAATGRRRRRARRAAGGAGRGRRPRRAPSDEPALTASGASDLLRPRAPQRRRRARRRPRRASIAIAVPSANSSRRARRRGGRSATAGIA